MKFNSTYNEVLGAAQLRGLEFYLYCFNVHLFIVIISVYLRLVFQLIGSWLGLSWGCLGLGLDNNYSSDLRLLTFESKTHQSYISEGGEPFKTYANNAHLGPLC